MDSAVVEAAESLMWMSQACTCFSKITCFSKVLTVSDVKRQQSRLILPTASVNRCIWPFCTLMQRQHCKQGLGCTLSVIDGVYRRGNRNREIPLVFNCWPSTGTFVFTNGWSDYVARKGLMQNDVVIFGWDSHYSLFFISFQKSKDNRKLKGIEMAARDDDANTKPGSSTVNGSVPSTSASSLQSGKDSVSV
jgi:hypothetical protein